MSTNKVIFIYVISIIIFFSGIAGFIILGVGAAMGPMNLGMWTVPSILGVISFSIGVFLGIYIIYLKYILSQQIGAGRPLVILTALFCITGIQLISTGLIGEMIVRKDIEQQNQELTIQKYVSRTIE